MLSSHLRLGLPSGLFTSGLPTETLHKPLLSAIRIQQHTLWELYIWRQFHGAKLQLQKYCCKAAHFTWSQ
jgi:hypothetical protein